eukprot:2052946-Rhodomonas_salina.2
MSVPDIAWGGRRAGEGRDILAPGLLDHDARVGRGGGGREGGRKGGREGGGEVRLHTHDPLLAYRQRSEVACGENGSSAGRFVPGVLREDLSAVLPWYNRAVGQYRTAKQKVRTGHGIART